MVERGPVWPVSVKGVLVDGGEVVVLRNERDEWELPGGRLEPDDASTADALAREIQEELGIEAAVGELIDTWIYEVVGKRVLIVTFACTADLPEPLTHSDEHMAVARMTAGALAASGEMPAGYLRSIQKVLG